MKHPIIPLQTYHDVTEILYSGKLSDFRGAPGEYYLGGKWVRKLEDAFCEYFNVKYAVAMNSATSCLHVALLATGVNATNNVIVSPYTFSSSASCVLMVGANPKFADIDEDTFNIKPEIFNYYQTTDAIIPVHLMGHPADMHMIPSQKPIIEDAAQAIGAEYHGRKVGTIGDCGIFSFNQSKQISSGEGGMLITNDDRIAEVSRALRNHAEVSCPELKMVGYNYRMNEIEAAIVYRQFQKIDQNIAYRTELADHMTSKLVEIEGFTPPYVAPNCKHSYYTYGVKVDESKVGMTRNELQKRMAERGVYFGSGYVKPLFLLPIYQGYGFKKEDFPVTMRMYEHELCVFDWLRYPATFKDIDNAIKVLKEVLHGKTDSL